MAAAFRQYILYFSSILPLTEPNAPPANVRGQNASSTNILVQWGDVPAADRNGIILSYTVTYIALSGGSPLTKEVDAPLTQANLTGLNKYTNYSITVSASTSKGGGNASVPIIVITDEDSKLQYTSGNFTISHLISHVHPKTYSLRLCRCNHVSRGIVNCRFPGVQM